MDYYETLTGNTKGDQWKIIRARKRYLRGVGVGFELVRRRLRATLAERSVREKER